MGMAWHEIYTICFTFPRTSKSSLDAARTMALSQARTLLAVWTSSRIPRPSQRKHRFPCFPLAFSGWVAQWHWVPCLKKGKKKGTEIYRPASLTSGPGKITHSVFLGSISKCEEQKVWSCNQHRFTRDKWCSAKQSASYNKMTQEVLQMWCTIALGKLLTLCPRAFSFGRGRTVDWKKWWLRRLKIAYVSGLRVTTNGSGSAWWPAMSKVPQRLNSCSYCLNVLISDLGPANISHVKLEGETFTMNSRTWIHWGFDNLENWANRNLTMSKKEKSKLLLVGQCKRRQD